MNSSERGSQVGKGDPMPKRASIIDAAVSEFSAGGYDGTSMDRIAEVSGASKRTVYNYFPSKDLLFQAVIDEYGSAMHSLKSILYDASRSLESQLSDFIDSELALLSEPRWRGFARVLVATFVRNPRLAVSAVSRNAGSEDPLLAWIRAAVADGRLEAPDPLLAARLFAAMMGGAFTWPALYQGSLDQALVEPLRTEIIETFLSRYGVAR